MEIISKTNEILNFSNLLSYFYIFSFLGWCLEVIYTSAVSHQVVNRGFLFGPICPIYGFGMVFLIVARHFFDGGKGLPLWIIFISGFIICSIVELVGGFALKQIFGLRWWDYSNEKLNLNGYVCAKFSIYWGLLSVLIIDIIRRMQENNKIFDFSKYKYTNIILLILLIITLIDLIVTSISLVHLEHDVLVVKKLESSLSFGSNVLSNKIGSTAIKMSDGYKRILTAFPDLKNNIFKKNS